MERRRIVAALCDWFDVEARDLPWRRRRTAYSALIAEAMLQQTQVARVVDRFREFMRRFPTVRALAEADEQAVLAQWQGLGYYRRARHLHAAARMVRDDFRGRVPTNAAELIKLPGVGPYSAGSIASIIGGHAEPIVDGNVRRVLARWCARGGCPADRESIAWTWEEARRNVELADRPGVFNEAMMELGATVCTPAAPRCEACPVAKHCQAREQGRERSIPPPRPAAKQRRVHHHVVVIRRADKILFEQRGRDGLWAGMWQAPTIESDTALDEQAILDALPMRVESLTAIGSFTHTTTHRLIEFQVFSARSRVRKGEWRELDDVADLPLSAAQRRVLGMVEEAGR